MGDRRFIVVSASRAPTAPLVYLQLDPTPQDYVIGAGGSLAWNRNRSSATLLTAEEAAAFCLQLEDGMCRVEELAVEEDQPHGQPRIRRLLVD